MLTETEGLFPSLGRDAVPAWKLLVRGLGAPRWAVLSTGVLAAVALFAVDHAIDSDAHVLLGFFVIVVATTWAGFTTEAVLYGEAMLGVQVVLDARRAVGTPVSLLLLSFISGAVLLGIGILLTRTFRETVLEVSEANQRDSLTGLLNTRALQTNAELERSKAIATGRPISIAFLDLDHFKNLNDEHGHIVGDNVLTTFGQILASSVRSTDIVGRVGGDEFTLVLPDTDQFETAAVLQRIRHRMAMRTDIPLVTATIGYVTFTTPPGSVEDMIKMADDLMYKGKNRREEGGTMIGKVANGSGSQLGSDPGTTIDITDTRTPSPQSADSAPEVSR